MTKANLKNLYKEWNKEISKLYIEDTTLKEMQELNAKYGTGHKWCSWEVLLKDLIMTGDVATKDKAIKLYSEHIMIETRKEELRKVAIATNNFEI